MNHVWLLKNLHMNFISTTNTNNSLEDLNHPPQSANEISYNISRLEYMFQGNRDKPLLWRNPHN